MSDFARRFSIITLLIFLIASLAGPVMAAEEKVQKEKKKSEKTETKEETKAEKEKKEAKEEKPEPTIGKLYDPPEFKSLKYRLLGPAWGGRVARAAGVPGNPSVYYFAGAASGVWKTTDAGQTWKPIFDDQPTSSIGSLAIAPSDFNTIYVGAGEANIRGNVAAGDGIYKSVDGGKTWNHVWKQTGHIGTIAVHPTNADIAFAAVLGHAFGPNHERGVYRTKDGGKTWVQVLKKDENTGASDVAIDPSNPNIVFAGLWQTRRTPWSLTSGGSGSALYVSRDGGDKWKQLTGKGLPEGIWGKIGVAVAPSDSRRVYALIEADQGGMFRSDDGGDSWTRVSGNRLIRQRAWYYSTITVHPVNENEVWCPQVPMLKSIDGGQTWTIVKGIPHGDNHDVWFDPKNPKRMIGADDGGVNLSNDGGESWWEPPLPLGQFYHVSVDSRNPFSVAGAQQDIGTAQGPSRSMGTTGIRNAEWYGVGGGEAGHVVSDPSDPNIVYGGEYLGYISIYDRRTGQSRNIGAYPEDGSGHGAEDLKYRFQWTAPIAVSPHTPKVVYHGANVLFKTDNGGMSWTAISGDLTRNDKEKQKWSGGPITGDNTGVEFYDTIFAIAESPAQKDLIWVGSDDGLVHITKDGGKNWKDVTSGMHGIPEWGTISIIEPSHFDAGTAYVAVDAHRLDDVKPYLYKTTDFGSSWSRLDSDLPDEIYLHSVREDPTNKEILYVGTERGVVFSKDGGKKWQALKLNMPTVAVHDLQVKDDSLVVATLGRSLWIFDHLAVLRSLNSKSSEKAQLLASPVATRWQLEYQRRGGWSGENPPARGALYYWLKDSTKDDITIEIYDSTNRLVNRFSSKPQPVIGYTDNPKDEEEAAKKNALSKDAGVQVVPWDLSYKGADLIPNAKIDEGDPSNGAAAPPGTYTIRMKVGDQTYTNNIKVEMDPRDKVSEADLATQLQTALAVRDDISRLTHIILQLRSVRQQLKNRNELFKSDPKGAQLIKDSQSLSDKLDALEAQMHNPKAEVTYDILAFKGGAKLYSRLAAVYAFVTEADGLPTQGVKDEYALLKHELDNDEAQFKQMTGTDLSALNDAAKNLNAPIVIVPPVPAQ